MLHPVCWWLSFGLGSFLVGQVEAPSPVEPPEWSRPYMVLILLVTVILMAFCVCKPIRHR
ncbi:unnamed protein product [Nyctereutes procyonoides]|uniref:(raccoon dog) hypothetical protein n=1 Tax=Nyctereutes procyonoides TaxID=34880 RepID=A0A811YX61_NYCPR|nr:unnamed protein product [Nyctereutes procyonoides]